MNEIKQVIKGGIAALNQDSIVENFIKKNKLVIYGAQSIKKQIGLFARPTKDYDIYASPPKKYAYKLEHTLDRHAGKDLYFTKQAIHPNTWKVKHLGLDMKPNTRDDISVADLSKPKGQVKTQVIHGIKYTNLSESKKDKSRALKYKKYKFRHAKDREDINRIKTYQEFNKW